MTAAEKLFYHVSCLKLCLHNSPHRIAHKKAIVALVKCLPPGSQNGERGAPSHGTILDLTDSNEDRLVFRTNRKYPPVWVGYTITLEKDIAERMHLRVDPANQDVLTDFSNAFSEEYHEPRQPQTHTRVRRSGEGCWPFRVESAAI